MERQRGELLCRKEYEPYAKQIFGNTPEMIWSFSQKIKLRFPLAKIFSNDRKRLCFCAMENTFYTSPRVCSTKPGDLIDENKWEDVIAHELFHHWLEI